MKNPPGHLISLKRSSKRILRNNVNDGRVHTRFPPEPNGYLHIGHAKSICLNFGLAKKYDGHTNLRFDDTNPVKEDIEYVDSIMEDVRWLGFDWDDRLYYASDYFEQLYEYAVKLIKKGKAYVCDMTAEEISETAEPLPARAKKVLTETVPLKRTLTFSHECETANLLMAKGFSGQKSIWPPPICTCATLFCTASFMPRITVPATHGASTPCMILPTASRDSIERITHSICTLEFEVHRPLYDWFIRELEIYASAAD